MNIQKNSFIDHIVFATVYSKINNESKNFSSNSIKGMEMRILSLLDSILSALSSTYSTHKVKLSNKIMLDHENKKFGAVKTSAQKVFSVSSEGADTSSTQSAAAAKKEKLEKVDQVLKKTVSNLPEVFGDLDVEHLFDTSSEIEDKARVYNEQKNLQKLTDYLKDNPADLDALSDAYQKIASDEFAENFKELFGDLGNLDPDALNETNPKYEEIAAQFMQEKDFEDFKKLLAENPGALVGFLLLLQTHVAMGGNLQDVWKTDMTI